MQDIKCVLVGNDTADKTQLLFSYTTSLLPSGYTLVCSCCVGFVVYLSCSGGWKTNKFEDMG